MFVVSFFLFQVGDFGLSTIQAQWDETKQIGVQPMGSLLWMAPEIIRMKTQNPYSFRSDVYAFGVVLYELMTGKLPYKEYKCRDQLLWLIGSRRVKLDDSEARKDTPKLFRRLFFTCIEFEPDKRPLFPQILSNLNHVIETIPRITRCRSLPTMKWGERGGNDFFGMLPDDFNQEDF